MTTEAKKPGDGGAAFPIIDVSSDYNRDTHEYDSVSTSITASGMSLRDYFAAKAMQGFIAANDKIGNEHAPHVACCAYFYADEMLAARSAGKGEA